MLVKWRPTEIQFRLRRRNRRSFYFQLRL